MRSDRRLSRPRMRDDSFGPPDSPRSRFRDSVSDSFAPRKRGSNRGGGGDSRQRLRVEHLVRMDYQVVPPEAIEAMRAAVEHGPRILKAEWTALTPPPIASGLDRNLAEGWETSPPVAECLQRLERKLDLILERLGIDVPGLKQRPLYNVTMSANGVRFRDHRRECQVGDMVYLCIEVPLDPTIEITALAETAHVVEDSGSRHLSAGRDVVLEFRVIQDEAREIIERYCRMQAKASSRTPWR